MYPSITARCFPAAVVSCCAWELPPSCPNSLTKSSDLSRCCLPFAVWPVMFLSISAFLFFFFFLKNVLFLLLFHLRWKYNDKNAGHYPRFH